MTAHERWFPDGPLDVDEPAHLQDATGFRPVVRRYRPPAELVDVVRRLWVPVWSLPPGETSVQRVLQYPVCQLVIGPDGGLLVGPHRGLSTEELSGAGWVVGVMLQPAAGAALAGVSVSELTDRRRDLHEADLIDTGALVSAVCAEMEPAPADVERQRRAGALVCEALESLLPVDEEGRLINAIVEYVEGEREVTRVGQLCDKFGMGERALQRLTRRRIGLSPKWLVQRRRLHDAAHLLGEGTGRRLADVAVELGYSDQAHFTRDFRSVTGVTPADFVDRAR